MALTDSLVSYWKLEEASGTRADSHGTNHLTDNNTVTQATGKLGNAAQFTAANSEWLSIADNASLSAGDTDFTLAAWVYLDSKSADRWFAAKGGEYMFGYRNGSDRLIFIVAKAGNPTSITAGTFGSPPTATWLHVVGWHDAVADQIGIAVNAGTANTAAYSAGVDDSTSAFEVGRGDFFGLNYMDGRIDALGFWRRVLTAQERTDLYNGGAGLEYPFGTAEWPWWSLARVRSRMQTGRRRAIC